MKLESRAKEKFRGGRTGDKTSITVRKAGDRAQANRMLARECKVVGREGRHALDPGLLGSVPVLHPTAQGRVSDRSQGSWGGRLEGHDERREEGEREANYDVQREINRGWTWESFPQPSIEPGFSGTTEAFCDGWTCWMAAVPLRQKVWGNDASAAHANCPIAQHPNLTTSGSNELYPVPVSVWWFRRRRKGHMRTEETLVANLGEIYPRQPGQARDPSIVTGESLLWRSTAYRAVAVRGSHRSLGSHVRHASHLPEHDGRRSFRDRSVFRTEAGVRETCTADDATLGKMNVRRRIQISERGSNHDTRNPTVRVIIARYGFVRQLDLPLVWVVNLNIVRFIYPPIDVRTIWDSCAQPGVRVARMVNKYLHQTGVLLSPFKVVHIEWDLFDWRPHTMQEEEG
ncbi:hypothetical protein BDM02DRAFT_3260271 [Thelephora ganbajun]|uniref:Uncharacterized protein n=1 Tax=Thelephora ganbajun TaxID=370292 RepID=A0ACB6ZIW1_THEGA|nr:hypothetical protein BDM02DRAFT_3260271 [Thelephora ganbajun]